MSNNKFKILVIEDETNICSFLETLLIANGYQTMTAKNCVTGNSLFMSYNRLLRNPKRLLCLFRKFWLIKR